MQEGLFVHVTNDYKWMRILTFSFFLFVLREQQSPLHSFTHTFADLPDSAKTI